MEGIGVPTSTAAPDAKPAAALQGREHPGHVTFTKSGACHQRGNGRIALPTTDVEMEGNPYRDQLSAGGYDLVVGREHALDPEIAVSEGLDLGAARPDALDVTVVRF
jgi:hypothetical protein